MLVNWFSTSGRGTKVSVGTIAHNVGGARVVGWLHKPMFGKTWEAWISRLLSASVLAFVAQWLLDS